MHKIRASLIEVGIVLLLIGAAGYSYDRHRNFTRRDAIPFEGQARRFGRLPHSSLLHGSWQTVVLDAGEFDSLEQWSRVPPEVAKFTRVCSYDRAGVGWSDPSAYPQTRQQIAAELHETLTRADISGPYLPVGHSIAGLYARVFVSKFRNEVAGLVLVDSVHPDELQRFPSHFPIHPLIFGALRLLFGSARLLQVGCRQSGAHPDCSKFVVNVARQLGVLPTSYAEAGEISSLGALPVIVITHDPHVGLAKIKNDEEETAWTRWQEDLARLSSDSSLVMVNGVGHEIQTDKPQVVVDAIERLVTRWRGANEGCHSVFVAFP